MDSSVFFEILIMDSAVRNPLFQQNLLEVNIQGYENRRAEIKEIYMQLKDKKIVILKGKNISTTSMAKLEWTPIHEGKLWAYVRQLSQKEFWASMAVNSSEEMLFIVNWRNDINLYCCVLYDGKYYDIKRIDTFEGYKTELKIYAEGGKDVPPLRH